MDIVAFLTARLDEDEQIANAAVGQQWEHAFASSREDYSFWSIHTVHPDAVEVAGTGFDNTGGIHDEGSAVHIARHDPARVLRDVAAKRRLMDVVFEYEAKIDGEWGCCHSAESIKAGRCEDTDVNEIDALRVLAGAYIRHPDYDPAWALT